MHIALPRKLLVATTTALLLAGTSMAQAATADYNVVTTWYEPDTQPSDSIFTGTFSYDSTSHVISNLQGMLTESMTGTASGSAPYFDMTQVALTYQLVSWYDSSLGGTFAASFSKNSTATFMGDTWAPADGIDVGGVFAGGPRMSNYASSIQNAYALIFVPDNPTASLSQAQIDKLAYADCAPGGMMGAVCMTGTSLNGYGAVGTMSGFPVSQLITAAAPVPEPETYAMLLAGLGILGAIARRRSC